MSVLKTPVFTADISIILYIIWNETQWSFYSLACSGKEKKKSVAENLLEWLQMTVST